MQQFIKYWFIKSYYCFSIDIITTIILFIYSFSQCPMNEIQATTNNIFFKNNRKANIRIFREKLIIFRRPAWFQERSILRISTTRSFVNIEWKLSKRLINLLLFIDFRKAFDTVDADLLILKLFHYGFYNLSLDLMKNYFTDRFETTKLWGASSDKTRIQLGVP